jgi:hypothetical protein
MTGVIATRARTNTLSVPIWSATSTESSVLKPEPSTHSFYYFVNIATSNWTARPAQDQERTRSLSLGMQRILARQPEVIRRARELRTIVGDPIEELAQVLQDIPVEDDVWDRISQEPYG